jgi:hypothetical protein
MKIDVLNCVYAGGKGERIKAAYTRYVPPDVDFRIILTLTAKLLIS